MLVDTDFPFTYRALPSISALMASSAVVVCSLVAEAGYGARARHAAATVAIEQRDTVVRSFFLAIIDGSSIG